MADEVGWEAWPLLTGYDGRQGRSAERWTGKTGQRGGMDAGP